MLRNSSRHAVWLAATLLWASAWLTAGASAAAPSFITLHLNQAPSLLRVALAGEGTPTATGTPEPSHTPTPTHLPEPTATGTSTVTPTSTTAPEPTATPTLTPTAEIQFWVDDDRISAGNCVDIYWQTSNVSAVHFDGRKVLESGSFRTCPCFDETHVLDVTLLDGSHDIRYITIDVKGTCATPTIKPTKRPPKPTPEPTETPTPIPSSGDIADPSRPRSSTLEGNWAQAVNLSLSGAATQPQIVAAPDGKLWAFWWDEFNGLVTTSYEPAVDGPGAAWSPPVVAPIIVTKIVGEGDDAETVSSTVGAMPYIVGAADYAHAFWLGEPDEETGRKPLMHARLWLRTRLEQSTVGAWSEAQILAETALLWRVTQAPDGTLHLAYVRPVHSELFPAGIYHKRSLDNGATWGPPSVLYGDIYYRSLNAEEAHFTTAADGQGHVFVIWDDPRLERSFMALSSNGGASWGQPWLLRGGAPDASAAPDNADQGVRRAHVVPAGSEVLLLWEQAGAMSACAMYQQQLVTVTRALTVTWSPPQPILEELTTCPAAPVFLQTAEGNPLMLIGTGGEALTVAAWTGSARPGAAWTGSPGAGASGPGWSEPKSLNFSFDHPELDRQVFLSDLRSALAGAKLAVVGLGQHRDVWYLESAVDTWEWVFAPPPAWAGPLTVGQTAGYPGRPVMAADAQGALHAIWSESPAADARGMAIFYARLAASTGASGGTGELAAQWSRPAQILQSPEGHAEQPALAAFGDLLYAVWVGGQGDRIYASQAYARDAYAPGGWSQPQEVPLAGMTASSPSLLVDAYGRLHLVYAVPLNEGRGIYYTAAGVAPNGLTSAALRVWEEPNTVFDAEASAWAMVDHPVLALDPAGTLHVAWVRGSTEGPFAPQGIFYARSTDAGLSWSPPREMAEGAYAWPQVAAPLTGYVHLLWTEAGDGDTWTHRWSVDYGDTWSYQQPVRGFRDVPGPVGLAVGGASGLHLVGLGRDESDRPALAYSVWRQDAGSWEGQELFRVGQVQAVLPGVALTLQAADGRLDTVFRAEVAGEEGTAPAVLHAQRTVPTVGDAPEALYTPVPTATPLPSPTPPASPTPRPQVEIQPPAAAPPIVGLGPVTLPVIAVAGLGLALLIILAVLVASRRTRGR